MKGDLSDEIRAHLDEKAEDLVASGMPREEAEHAARRAFGNVLLTEQTAREVWSWPALDNFLMDVRYAIRMLRKSPGFTAIAIITLALGIGANTAIFSLIDAVMFRTLPVRDPQQLVLFMWRANANGAVHQAGGGLGCPIGYSRSNPGNCVFSGPLFERIHREQRSFDGTFAFGDLGSVLMSFGGRVSHAQGDFVSGDFFSTLEVPATIGRTIEPSDDSLAATPVIVLSHRLWASSFGSDPSVIGKSVYLHGHPFTIAGVAAPNFFGLNPGMPSSFWVPMAFAKSFSSWWDGLTDSHATIINIAARLKPGFSDAQARAVTSAMFTRDVTTGPDALFKPSAAPRLALASLAGGLGTLRQSYSQTLLLSLILTGIVLLLACANVAGLGLARSAARQKEVAVRLALGTTRWRLIRQLLTESTLLAGAGGVAGTLLAYWGASSVLAFLSGSHGWLGVDVHPDPRMLCFAILLSAGAGILAGLAPALRATRVDLTPALKESGWADAKEGRSWHRLSFGSALVVVQAALSVLVLASAALLVQSVGNREGQSVGFLTKNLLTFYPDPLLTGVKGPQLAALYRQLQMRLAALPGVVSVTYSSSAPMGQGLGATTYDVAGKPEPRDNWDMPNMLSEMWVGPHFFKTLGVPIVAGRALSQADLSSTAKPEPIVVNQEFVRQALGEQNPLGVKLANPPGQIVGVAGDTNYESPLMDATHWPLAYFALRDSSASFEIRTAGNPKPLIPAIRQVVSQTNSELVMTGITTVRDRIAEILYQERLIGWLSSLFALLALLLACIGLYGLLAWEVTRRTREIGIRMALGAERGEVLRMVLRRGAKLAVIGTVAGLGLAFGLTRLLRHFLFGVSATDPVSFAAVAGLLLVTALAACYFPARRAMRVDPMAALRNE